MSWPESVLKEKKTQEGREVHILKQYLRDDMCSTSNIFLEIRSLFSMLEK